MLQITENISDLWNYLGSAWSEFENKAMIEAFWLSMASGIDFMNSSMFDAQKSRSLKYLEPILSIGPEWYTITYSGVETNIAEPGDGTFHYQLPSYIYEMPILSGIDAVYYNGIDYTISGMDTLVWNSTWPKPTFRNSIKLKAPIVNRLNPVLMNTWAQFVGTNLELFQNYNDWGINTYTHLKYFIWALIFKQTQPPTIKNLTDALGIVKGAPFAHNSGRVTYNYLIDHYEIYVDDVTYIFPSGLYPIASGIVSQFDLLCSGVNVYDYINHPDLIDSYSNKYNRKNTLICSLSDSVKNLSYSEELYGTYISGIFPCQFRYIYI